MKNDPPHATLLVACGGFSFPLRSLLLFSRRVFMTKNEIENPVYDTRNIRITRICVVILLIICAVMLVRGPWLTDAFVRGLHGRDFLLSDKPYAFGVTITIGYICGTLALVMLIMMFRFLGRLAQGNVFTRQNVQTLYRISLCCIYAAGACLIMGLLSYWMFGALAAGILFMALIVRVVRDAFERAVSMKDELDYTI